MTLPKPLRAQAAAASITAFPGIARTAQSRPSGKSLDGAEGGPAVNHRALRIDEVELTGILRLQQIDKYAFAERTGRCRGADQRDGSRPQKAVDPSLGRDGFGCQTQCILH